MYAIDYLKNNIYQKQNKFVIIEPKKYHFANFVVRFIISIKVAINYIKILFSWVVNEISLI